MIHSRGLNSAAHGSRLPRIASPQDFQRCRPRSHLMWQLADGRLVRHDRTFPPLGAEAEVRPSLAANLSMPTAQRPTLVGTVRDVDEDAEGEMMAQLIWHHGERSYPSHLINLARNVSQKLVAQTRWSTRPGGRCPPTLGQGGTSVASRSAATWWRMTPGGSATASRCARRMCR